MYRYRGRVALGIPDISSQTVASAFYCDAKIQVVDKTELRIQVIFLRDLFSDMNLNSQNTYLGINEIQISVKEFPTGSYFIRVFTNNKAHVSQSVYGKKLT